MKLTHNQPMNILFLCTANMHRSRTAEDFFRTELPLNLYKSAGLSEKECRRNGTVLCTEALLDWADQVYVFEQKHLDRIQAYTREQYLNKIICLNIPDIYQYMQPKLIEELEPLRSRLSESVRNKQ